MDIRATAEYEHIPFSSEQESFAVREFCVPAFPSPWHFHIECEIHTIARGRGQRLVGDHVEPFGPGDTVLLGAGLPHVWHSQKPVPGGPKNATHSVVVQFREDCLGTDFWKMPEVEGARKLLERASRGLQVLGRSREQVSRQLWAMLKQPAQIRLLSLLRVLFDLAESDELRPLSSPGFVPVRDNPVSQRIDRIHRYIAENFNERWNHGELARDLRMSSSGLSHFYRRTTGRNLSYALAEYRIGQACHLLITTEKTVSEIAYSCGFESLSPFHFWFRRLRGMSPREYRAQQRMPEGG